MISVRGRHWIDVGFAWDRCKIRARSAGGFRGSGARVRRRIGRWEAIERWEAIGKGVWRSEKGSGTLLARCCQGERKKDRVSRWPNVVGADGCRKGWKRQGGKRQALYLSETPRKHRKGYRKEGCHD